MPKSKPPKQPLVPPPPRPPQPAVRPPVNPPPLMAAGARIQTKSAPTGPHQHKPPPLAPFRAATAAPPSIQGKPDPNRQRQHKPPATRAPLQAKLSPVGGHARPGGAIVQAMYRREEMEEIGREIGQSILDYQSGFYELNQQNQHVWHQGGTDRAGFVNTNTLHRGGFFRYPVFRREGFYERDRAGTVSWHAGTNYGTRVNTGATHLAAGHNYPLYREEGFYELDRTGTLNWHGDSNYGLLINTGATQAAGGNNYPLYRENGFFVENPDGVYTFQLGAPNHNTHATDGTMRHGRYPVYNTWLRHLVRWLANPAGPLANDPAYFQTTHDTYRFRWNNAIPANGGSNGFGINIHKNGILGSCWIMGVDNVSVNRQGNPSANALEDRLKFLLKYGWTGQAPIITTYKVWLIGI